jgi:hypothetical protein
MTTIFIGLITFSLAYLVSVPMVRLWTVSSEEVRQTERSPAMGPR